jgi:formylglycine-generating enzyme required for sulfatase activity
MLISTDRTGFPLVVVEEAGVEIQLLPVTKWQFAQFMAEAKTELQEAYQEMLTLNPAAAHEHFSDREREQLFVSGILPEEALAFARWLGEGFDLPTLKEWRAVYAALRREPPPRHHQIQDFVDGVA